MGRIHGCGVKKQESEKIEKVRVLWGFGVTYGGAKATVKYASMSASSSPSTSTLKLDPFITC
jgi:hypothetical protein